MRTSPWFILLLGFTLTTEVRSQEAKGQPDKKLPWVTPAAKAPRVEFRTFDSRTVGAKVSYHVYTPEAYDQPKARLPVLYWLHGTEGGLAGIAPLTKHFHETMGTGSVPPMIVVFVNGLPRRLWADSKNGAAPVETVFITELIPEVDKNLRTIASREGRILEGFSMGGYGAARLGMRYPELFAGISILAGGPFDLELQGPRAKNNPQLREFILREVCDNDLDYFKALNPLTILDKTADKVKDKKLIIRQAVGRQDNLSDMNRKFHDKLSELKIAHEYTELPMVGHECLTLLQGLGERNGTFYRSALGRPTDGSKK